MDSNIKIRNARSISKTERQAIYKAYYEQGVSKKELMSAHGLTYCQLGHILLSVRLKKGTMSFAIVEALFRRDDYIQTPRTVLQKEVEAWCAIGENAETIAMVESNMPLGSKVRRIWVRILVSRFLEDAAKAGRVPGLWE